jgi:SAM-dependent methyltransferase
MTLRDLCGRLARLGRARPFDYRRAYARADLARDYWTVVGPATREEYDRLGGVKLKLLIDLGLAPAARVLDVGCGTGLLAAALEGHLSDRGLYVGTDLAPEAVAFCRRRFRRPNFSFVQNEMTALPLPARGFDAIAFYSVFTHTYPEETALLLAEAGRVLAPRGFAFADAFTSPDVRRSEGDRGAVVVGAAHLARLIAEAGLRAEPVMTLEGPRGSGRAFLKLTPAAASAPAGAGPGRPRQPAASAP